MFPQIPFGYLNNIQVKNANSSINFSILNINTYVVNVKNLEINTSINQVVSDSKVSLLNYADSGLNLSNISIKTTTEEYKQILSSLTLSPITIDSILTGEPLTDFGAFMEISTNTVLQSNTRYLTTTSGRVHTFPSSPSVGDVVEMATGNFDTRINHGNSSQQVRNLSTLTTAGTDSGVLLKPYSICQFIYVGSNLWVTGYRARTINNWLGATLWNPSEIASNWVLGIDASDAANPSTIADKSGNGRNALALGSPPTLQSSSQNGLNTLYLNNRLNIVSAFSIAEVYLLYKPSTESGADKGILSLRDNFGSPTSDYTTVLATDGDGSKIYEGGTTNTPYINGSSAPTNSIGGAGFWYGFQNGIQLPVNQFSMVNYRHNNLAAGTKNLFVGGDSASNSLSLITLAELNIFNSALSSENREKMQGYYAHKWGTTSLLPSDHPYKSLPPLLSGGEIVAT